MLRIQPLRRSRLSLGHLPILYQTSRSFASSILRLDAEKPRIQKDTAKAQGKGWTPLTDWTTPKQSNNLAKLLKDILPTSVGNNDAIGPDSVVPLDSQGWSLPDFLVYWPLPNSPSELAPDGADPAHVPDGFNLAGPNDPASQGIRLWKSGSVEFKKNWRRRFPLNPSIRTAKEIIVPGGPQSRPDHVEIVRQYGQIRQGTISTQILEKRTLAFVKGGLAERILGQAAETPGVERDSRLPTDPDHVHEFTTTPAQLFQFSALTYNAHYIHLDPKNGLVHGPLQMSLMLRVAEQHIELAGAQRQVYTFKYTCVKPLKVGQKAKVCLRREAEEGEWRVWIERGDGRLIAEGTVTTRQADAGIKGSMESGEGVEENSLKGVSLEDTI